MGQGTLSWMLLVIGAFSSASATNQASLRAVVRGNNQFSTQFYDVIRKTHGDQNLIVCPISVSSVLAMLQAGAQGQTQDQIRSSVHFPSNNQLHSGYRTLLQELQQANEHVNISMVNRIFPAAGFQLDPKYTSILKSFYYAEPHQLNYANDKTAAIRYINNFVANATQDKIQNLLQASDVDATTKLVLINAIYFKGKWQEPFDASRTHQAKFYTSETESQQVNMMQTSRQLLYANIPELDAQVVSIPYKGDRLSMLVLVPNQRTGYVQMEEKLKSFTVDKIVERMAMQQVTLSLPKFKVESNIDLSEPLKQLGLGEIFSPQQSNFNGISAEKLYVSKALQKAVIDVNEHGSEAAAAGAAVMLTGSFYNPNETRVTADHPFTAMVVVNQKDQVPTTPLFITRVKNISTYNV